MSKIVWPYKQSKITKGTVWDGLGEERLKDRRKTTVHVTNSNSVFIAK